MFVVISPIISTLHFFFTFCFIHTITNNMSFRLLDISHRTCFLSLFFFFSLFPLCFILGSFYCSIFQSTFCFYQDFSLFYPVNCNLQIMCFTVSKVLFMFLYISHAHCVYNLISLIYLYFDRAFKVFVY